jgi:hypothetical protein
MLDGQKLEAEIENEASKDLGSIFDPRGLQKRQNEQK